jgi:hypothetical protein
MNLIPRVREIHPRRKEIHQERCVRALEERGRGLEREADAAERAFHATIKDRTEKKKALAKKLSEVQRAIDFMKTKAEDIADEIDLLDSAAAPPLELLVASNLHAAVATFIRAYKMGQQGSHFLVEVDYTAPGGWILVSVFDRVTTTIQGIVETRFVDAVVAAIGRSEFDIFLARFTKFPHTRVQASHTDGAVQVKYQTGDEIRHELFKAGGIVSHKSVARRGANATMYYIVD